MDSGAGLRPGGRRAVPLVAVTPEPLNLQALTEEVSLAASADGAVTSFIGLVRDHNQGRRVSYLEYEAYEPLALRALHLIVDESAAVWPTARLAVHHRTGRLEIGETSVVIAVSAPHRRAAFEACEWAIRELKRTVPIWKKEIFEDGEVWVEGEGITRSL